MVSLTFTEAFHNKIIWIFIWLKFIYRFIHKLSITRVNMFNNFKFPEENLKSMFVCK